MEKQIPTNSMVIDFSIYLGITISTYDIPSANISNGQPIPLDGLRWMDIFGSPPVGPFTSR